MPAAGASSPGHPVDELLPPGRLFAYGLQHVLAMYAGAVAVPLIVGGALGLPEAELVYLINADLFTSGLATLLQTLGLWKFGVRLPVVQGVTFAAVSPMILIARQGGLPTVYGAIIVAGAVTLLLAPHASRLLRLFPPVVTGSIITLIGLSLLPVAVRWAGGGNPASPEFGAPRHLGLAFGTLALVLLYKRLLTGFLRSIAVLLGLVSGMLLAAPLGLVHLQGVMRAHWFGITTPFAFGWPRFDVAAVLAMTLVMLVVMVESTGDFMALGEIVDRPLDEKTLAAGLRADGLSTLVGGVLNAFPYTAYAQNVGLVALTQVRSRYVVAAAGFLLMLLGLFPKAAALVAAIPLPVLGGAGLVMFGQVAASGIETLGRVSFEGDAGRRRALLVGTSLALGLIPVGAEGFYKHLPGWLKVLLHSGITAGSLAAILLHLLLGAGEGRGEESSEGRST